MQLDFLYVGSASGQLKAILGDASVNANGAVITLREGQTRASFALVNDSEISADLSALPLGTTSPQNTTNLIATNPIQKSGRCVFDASKRACTRQCRQLRRRQQQHRRHPHPMSATAQ